MDNADLIERSKIAEQAGRYEDMVGYMTSVTESGAALSNEERNLLSIAYKNVVGAKRASWRILYSLEQKYLEAKDSREQLARDYRLRVETELRTASMKIIGLIDEYILSKVTTAESKVYFLKMKADYYRYLAEVSEPTSRATEVKNAHETYELAFDIGKKDLPPTNPVFLGLVLNYSVFFYEILGSPDKACQMAEQTFNDAVSKLDVQDDEAYKDASLILQLLRDNLALWNTD